MFAPVASFECWPLVLKVAVAVAVDDDGDEDEDEDDVKGAEED